MLDLRSLFFVGALTCAVCAVMMLSMRDVHAPSRRAISWGAIAELWMGTSLMLIALRGFIPDFASIVVANSIGTSGALLILATVRRIAGGVDWPIRLVSAMLAIFSVEIYLGTAVEFHLHRIVFSSLVQAACVGACVPILMSRRGVDPPIAVNWGIAFCGIYAGVHLARVIGSLVNGITTTSDGMVSGNSMIAIVVVIFTLAPMVFALLLVGLVNGRLAADYRRIAEIDTLTGLRTRRSFFERAGALLVAGSGTASREPTSSAAFMMVDIDHFKHINDTLGHAAGDQVLERFASVLRQALPANAVVGRYGGEEFCVFLPTISPAAARDVANTLQCQTGMVELEHPGKRQSITVSVGMAFSPRDGTRLQELLLVADRRVYLAKAAGRNRIVATDQEGSPGTDRRAAMAGMLPV